MIDYLKKYSLPFGLRKTVKPGVSRGPSPSYTDAKNILLFFSSEGNQKIALMRSYINKFKKDGALINELCKILTTSKQHRQVQFGDAANKACRENN